MAGTESHYILPRPGFDKPVKVLIVVAPYYRDIADNLLAGARAELEAAGAAHETIEVPGALEIPSAIALAHSMANFDGYVALGCVIRGETTHYDYDLHGRSAWRPALQHRTDPRTRLPGLHLPRGRPFRGHPTGPQGGHNTGRLW